MSIGDSDSDIQAYINQLSKKTFNLQHENDDNSDSISPPSHFSSLEISTTEKPIKNQPPINAKCHVIKKSNFKLLEEKYLGTKGNKNGKTLKKRVSIASFDINDIDKEPEISEDKSRHGARRKSDTRKISVLKRSESVISNASCYSNAMSDHEHLGHILAANDHEHLGHIMAANEMVLYSMNDNKIRRNSISIHTSYFQDSSSDQSRDSDRGKSPASNNKYKDKSEPVISDEDIAPDAALKNQRKSSTSSLLLQREGVFYSSSLSTEKFRPKSALSGHSNIKFLKYNLDNNSNSQRSTSSSQTESIIEEVPEKEGGTPHSEKKSNEIPGQEGGKPQSKKKGNEIPEQEGGKPHSEKKSNEIAGKEVGKSHYERKSNKTQKYNERENKIKNWHKNIDENFDDQRGNENRGKINKNLNDLRENESKGSSSKNVDQKEYKSRRDSSMNKDDQRDNKSRRGSSKNIDDQRETKIYDSSSSETFPDHEENKTRNCHTSRKFFEGQRGNGLKAKRRKKSDRKGKKSSKKGGKYKSSVIHNIKSKSRHQKFKSKSTGDSSGSNEDKLSSHSSSSSIFSSSSSSSSFTSSSIIMKIKRKKCSNCQKRKRKQEKENELSQLLMKTLMKKMPKLYPLFLPEEKQLLPNWFTHIGNYPVNIGEPDLAYSELSKSRVDDALRQTIELTRQFLDSHQKLYDVYLKSLNSNHHFTYLRINGEVRNQPQSPSKIISQLQEEERKS